MKTFKADKCVNPFSLLNAVCHCSDGIQDLLKCRVTSETGLIECSIRDFVICTDFLVDKALAIMQEYCREQCSPDGFDIFSTPIGEGRYKKDYWRSYVFCDEVNDTLRGAFQVTLRGGQRGWLIGNNEQELQAIAERYPVLAGLVHSKISNARSKATTNVPFDRSAARQMRQLLGCLARVAETPVVPSDRQAAADFMTWGLKQAERLGNQALAFFKEYLKPGQSNIAS